MPAELAGARVLVIGCVWPEPRSSAAGSHMLQLLDVLLRAGCSITFACAAQPGDTRADLTALGITETAIALNCSSFDTVVRELDPAIVVFDRFMTEEQYGWRVAQACPQALRVLETSDLHCLREARHTLLKQALARGETGVPQPSDDALFLAMAQHEVALREIAAILRSDLSLMISPAEIELLQQRFAVPPTQLVYCPFLLDAPDAAQWQPFTEREHVVTIGNFLHAPNRDAVQWLREAIWPLVRAQLPQAELHIYGAYAPQQVREWHRERNGFLIKGWADDALAVMAQARLCLAPLRFGAGQKGKLVDAMLTGTPSVTTSVGAEGMHGTLPWPGAVADHAAAFAQATVQLYRDAASWQRAQQQCLPVLQAGFDRLVHGRAVIGKISRALANVGAHRAPHFTGRMLLHHQHRSTEFMGRWIEAKNRNL